MRNNNRSWFEGKKCFICSRQGTTFRLIKNRHYVLCDKKLAISVSG